MAAGADIEAEHRRKRRKLQSAERPTILDRKMSDLETSLEVDHMILDYLLHKAVMSCLASRKNSNHTAMSDVERALLQVDEFMVLFKSRYGDYNFDAEMRFRQHLLQLVTLFTQRYTRNSTTPPRTSLQVLRDSNRHRAYQWIGTRERMPTAPFDTKLFDEQLPISHTDLDRNRAQVLNNLGFAAEDDAYEDAFYGTSSATSLLDLLPLLMKVSAQCNELCNERFLGTEKQISESLMQLCASWMLQAALEQYLIFGATGSDAIDEAFAWGHKSNSQDEPVMMSDERPNGSVVIDPITNEMFEGDGGIEVDGWQEIRDVTLEELFSAADVELVPHLMSKAVAHSMVRFEQSALEYLEAMPQLLPPVLAQLERGQLAGMSKEETKKFLAEECGLNMSELFA